MARQPIRTLAYPALDDFIFGHAPHPVTTASGLVIGQGLVYPEINFTLPPMMVNADTMPEILASYTQATEAVCQRAVELHVPGLVVEIEVLPPMTVHPAWAADVTRAVVEVVRAHQDRGGLRGAVRLTAVDIREGHDLEHMWHGAHWDKVMATFEGAAQAGADLASIESVGGKAVHDEAVMYCDLAKSVFALTVLGAADLEHLWSAISQIGQRTALIPAGDTACAFANTAMVLAERHYIPAVFAAVVRVVSAVRSLVAVESGAQGPHKDCGYEGVYAKAIAGIPIAMEGRSATGAHLSPVGNIAACLADLWSNESIQNIKLLSGPAPTANFESLVYDCRLLNAATARGRAAAQLVRDLHADSDARWDPQAYVLAPAVVLRIAAELITVDDPYERGKLAARCALAELRAARQSGAVLVEQREQQWLDDLSRAADALPATAEELAASVAEDSEAYDSSKYQE